MGTFHLKMSEISLWNWCIFYFQLHKAADFHSNLLVSWELVTEGYQGRLMKCAKFKLKCTHFKRPLAGMVIFWLLFATIEEIMIHFCCISTHYSTRYISQLKIFDKQNVYCIDQYNNTLEENLQKLLQKFVEISCKQICISWYMVLIWIHNLKF